MAARSKATLRGRFWRRYFASIRYCYQCGGPLEKRYIKEEKTKRHICRRCKEITYLNPKVVAGCIPITRKGDVVLLKRSIEPAVGKWTFPAGFQEMGETIEEAARRESAEEACINVKIGPMIGVYSYPDAGVITVVYEGTIKNGSVPAVGDEALDIGIFTLNKIPWKALAFRSTIEALKDWKKRRR